MKKTYILPQTTEDIILTEQMIAQSIGVDNIAEDGLEGDAREEQSNLFGNTGW